MDRNTKENANVSWLGQQTSRKQCSTYLRLCLCLHPDWRIIFELKRWNG